MLWNAWQNYIYYSKGIQTVSTNPYTPEQNSRAERYNCTVLEKARTIIWDSVIEKEKWLFFSENSSVHN